MTSQAANQIVTILGANIRDARLSKGMTQRLLAQRMGLDTRAIGRWERDGISPSPTNLAKLSEILGREIAWFYTDHRVKPKRRRRAAA
jgi:transcriptional regulator with XRE-family HTH domain